MINTEIAVVGGGIIGLTAACLLAKQGFQVDLIENGGPPHWQPNSIPARVSALNLASRNLFQAVDIWDQVASQRITPYKAMDVWDSHSEARIRFNALEYAQSQLGFIVENELLCQILATRLSQNYNVRVHFDHDVAAVELNEERALIKVDKNKQQITADLLIAADGSNSLLRTMAGIPLYQEDFGQLAIVATLECTLNHQNTAWQCFTPDGPVAMLPLSEGQCSLVWSCDNQKAERLISAANDDFCHELEGLFGAQLGTLKLLNSPKCFPLKSRHAMQYISQRMVLIGDAAHTVHPLAGLGANLGLMDAAALVQTISTARSEGKPIGNKSVLRRYERWRKGENSVAMHGMRIFKSLFGSREELAGQIRQTGFAIANKTETIKRPLAEYAMGLIGDLPAACKQNTRLSE